MITSRFPLGDVSFSAEYFSTLVGEATKQCYGVAAILQFCTLYTEKSVSVCAVLIITVNSSLRMKCKVLMMIMAACVCTMLGIDIVSK